MLPRIDRRHLIASAVALALGAFGLPARAQDNSGFRPLPPQNAPPAQTITSTGASSCPPGTAGFQPLPPYNPNGTSPYPVYSPAGAALNGVASIYNAQGQYQIQYQQSRLINQQVQQAKLDTQRKTFEQWQYEQANTPTLQDNIDRQRQEFLRRARNDPPPTEIWSGLALNTLFQSIQRQQTMAGGQGPIIPLAPDLLQHINLNAGTTVGSVGLLKQGGKLEWPTVLRRGAYDLDRQKMDELAPKALQEAGTGQVSSDTIDSMTSTLKDLQSKLDDNVANMTPGDYTRSRRYINELNSTVQALQDPNIGKFASGKWSAQGDNVGQMLQNMTSQGLQFAPATNGDEPAYTALHNAMVAYNMGMSNLLAGR